MSGSSSLYILFVTIDNVTHLTSLSLQVLKVPCTPESNWVVILFKLLDHMVADL